MYMNNFPELIYYCIGSPTASVNSLDNCCYTRAKPNPNKNCDPKIAHFSTFVRSKGKKKAEKIPT